ncbi:MAG: hypothetical protein KDD22_04790, partial [Bdellovibrionales bacterium]|nr:hypothetical protein [Bdellovibrionales bacterium]
MGSYSLALAIWTMLSFSSISWANFIGSDAQNFAPTPDGIDFITVHSSETLEVGIFNLGFFLNYAQNTFPAYQGSGGAPQQSLLNKNDSLTSADLNFAVGVFKDFQLGMSFPFLIHQYIEDSNNLGRFRGTGISEIRPSAKYHIGNYGPWGFATVGSANFNRIRNNPYV